MTTTTSTKSATKTTAKATTRRARPRNGAAATPSYEVTLVTPVLAAQWLKTNAKNRPLREAMVERYARDMANGEWVMRGDAIEFSTKGKLINGQHRLTAIVKSGAAVALLVGRNLPEETQGVTDLGGPRRPGDHLGILGYKNPAQVGTIARLGWHYDNVPSHRPGNAKTSPTGAEVYNWVADNPIVELAAATAIDLRNRIGLPIAASGLAFVLCSRVDAEQAVEFMARLGDGADLDSDSPILAMRNRVIREKAAGGRVANSDWLKMLIQTWNAWREGRALLRVTRQGPSDDFPTPV